jgi:hypothetical protein
MAEEKKPGQGWEKKSDSNNAYQATFSVPKKPESVVQTASSSGTTANTNQQIRVIANNETGAIQLYEVRSPAGDRLFNTFNPSTGKWVSPSNDPKALTDIQNKIGVDGIQKLQNQSKQGAINGVINPTSTDENKAKIKSTDGYKSATNIAAPSGGNAGAAGTSSAPQNTIDDFLKEIAGGDIRSPDKYANLKYPEKMDPTQDCITFTMIEYVPKKVNTNFLGNIQNFGGDQIFTKPDGTSAVSGGTVTLPIQPTITDSNSVRWNDSTMSAIQAAAGAGALGLMTDAPQPPSTATDETKGENKDAVGKLVGYSLAGKAAGGEGGGFFTRATGAIVNPNLELLFEGPTLRNFSFTFTMSAREPSEAIIIKKIIRFFKQGMSVKRAQSALFLKSPHVFRIKYLYQGNKDHPWINKIKECALTSCTVNYTPSGSYATFEDGAMTQYDLTLSFSELEPIYDDDYTNLDGNKDEFIGY